MSIVLEAYFKSISVVDRIVVLLLGLLLGLPSAANAGQTSLALVSARDHIEGSMLTAQSVYADETRIYLATGVKKWCGERATTNRFGFTRRRSRRSIAFAR